MDVIEIPVSEIGINPTRQIRPVEDVRDLMEESNPENWEPLEICLWPAGDPYPLGEEGRKYLVLGGNHRVTAARELGLETVRAIVGTAPKDEREFLLRAYATNATHGKKMTSEQKQAVARRLHELGMSHLEIAREMPIPRGTITNWVTRRDTNAGRSVRHAPGERSDMVQEDGALTGLPEAWRTEVVDLDAQRIAEIAIRLNKVLNLGDLTTMVPPGEAVAWLVHQSPAMRRLMATRFEQIAVWWQGMAVSARLACDRTVDQGEIGA
jgi:hypothetical protein